MIRGTRFVPLSISRSVLASASTSKPRRDEISCIVVHRSSIRSSRAERDRDARPDLCAALRARHGRRSIVTILIAFLDDRGGGGGGAENRVTALRARRRTGIPRLQCPTPLRVHVRARTRTHARTHVRTVRTYYTRVHARGDSRTIGTLGPEECPSNRWYSLCIDHIPLPCLERSSSFIPFI